MLLLVVVLTALYALLQKTDEFSWQYVTNTVLLSFLGVVNFILILSLLVILLRYLVRLMAERRSGILGSRFRTRLVVSFLGLCLVPSMLLFVAALGIIERSVDRWFSTDLETIHAEARDLVDRYYGEHRRNALRHARDLSDQLALLGTTAPGRADLFRVMQEGLRQRQLDIVSVQMQGSDPLTVANPRLPLQDLKSIPDQVLHEAREGRTFSWQDSLGPGQLVRSGAPLRAGSSPEVIGVVVAGTFIEKDPASSTMLLARGVDNYRQLRLQSGNIKRVYILIFLLITLVILVSAVWVVVYLARGITVPIQSLAEGTREVASGNLDFQLDLEAGDELGMLITSFNTMTRDLKASRETIEDANRKLETRTAEAEQRRRYIETLLESIPAGVVSLDEQGCITTMNREARRILKIEPERDVRALPYQDLFGKPGLTEIVSVIPRLLGGSASSLTREFHVSVDEHPLSLSVTFSPLPLGGDGATGMLIVVEDITALIKAQKVAAWREVARRIAHEIKNPLTPIQLSAQRMLRKQQEKAADLGEAVEEGAATIVAEVKTLKTLVNEFSGFARMPAGSPAPANLHEVIDAALNLYQGAYQHVAFVRAYAPDLPSANLDREQMKRVFVNLIDNALEAMGRTGAIRIGTSWLAHKEMMRVEVADDGPGIPPEDKDKLFLPYFSTKKRGTGLGLAIVSRIVSDHHGYIRVEDNVPRGTRFVIELPAA